MPTPPIRSVSRRGYIPIVMPFVVPNAWPFVRIRNDSQRMIVPKPVSAVPVPIDSSPPWIKFVSKPISTTSLKNWWNYISFDDLSLAFPLPRSWPVSEQRLPRTVAWRHSLWFRGWTLWW